jgi:hypothetical protein
MGIPTAISLPRIIQRKENAPEFNYSSLYTKTGAADPLFCGGGLAFLVTCLCTAAHEETELLTVLKIPFRVRTPYSQPSRFHNHQRQHFGSRPASRLPCYLAFVRAEPHKLFDLKR